MNIPPLLIASATLFWGMASGNLLLGITMACLLGSVVLVPSRLSVSDEDCLLVSDLTSVIFLSAVALILLNVEKTVFLKEVVIWQPPVLLPLIVAQLFSGRERMVIGTRFRLRKKKTYKHSPLDFRIYYLAICFLSAAMANNRSDLFLPGAAALFFWLLLANRGMAFSRATFAAVFLLAVGCGYLTTRGAELMHGYAREKTRNFFRNYYFSQHTDPFQTHLSFGTIGRLKTSGTIVLRLRTKEEKPALLRQASYESYGRETWHSRRQYSFVPLNGDLWEMLPAPPTDGRRATIEYYLPKEKGMLPQPYGTYRVRGPTIYKLEEKADGAARIVDGAPLIAYDVVYVPSLLREDDLPTKRNLSLPAEIEELLDKVLDGDRLEGFTEPARVALVENFFRKNGFTYSLTRSGRGTYPSPLANFLLGDRKGYCELFATATTLLLRKVGIPSRYVVGYAVEEKSAFEKKYIVRDRHAHAWSEAYVDGRWLVVDTTPADWFAKESENSSFFEHALDILSYFKLKYEHFRIQTEQNYRFVLSVVVVVLTVVLVVRIVRRLNAKGALSHPSATRKSFEPVSSPLDLVESAMSQMGVDRHTDEHFLHWAGRINREREIGLTSLEKLFRLHMRLRFDPAGLECDEQNAFQEQVDRWLQQYEKGERGEGSRTGS